MLVRFSFASGADEKVVRVFKAPANFIDNFRRLCSTGTEKDLRDTQASDLSDTQASDLCDTQASDLSGKKTLHPCDR